MPNHVHSFVNVKYSRVMSDSCLQSDNILTLSRHYDNTTLTQSAFVQWYALPAANRLMQMSYSKEEE